MPGIGYALRNPTRVPSQTLNDIAVLARGGVSGNLSLTPVAALREALKEEGVGEERLYTEGYAYALDAYLSAVLPQRMAYVHPMEPKAPSQE